jgi:hypothetical protein
MDRTTQRLRVHVIDHDRYERETRIVMAWRGVERQLSGGEPEEIRAALKEALYRVGEDAEPPDSWVQAIANQDRGFWIHQSDLK